MAKIPSTEKTDDFIYRIEIKKGSPLHEPNDPHLLVFEQFVGPAGPFHSMDVTTLRDGQPTTDIEFHCLKHVPQAKMTYLKFEFYDHGNCVTEHDYLLTAVLRYLI